LIGWVCFLLLGSGTSAEAVVDRAGHQVVFVVRDGRAMETEVKTGQSFRGNLEIREGVSQGEQVILSPEPSLSNGTRVKMKLK